MAVVGKLLSGLLSILNGFGHHLRFHFLEGDILIDDRVLILIGYDRHALLEQFALAGNDTTHLVNLGGGDGDDQRNIVAVGLVLL